MDHIGDLPDEVFAKILNLLPIQHVIRCAIVSKRWDAACRYIIRTRQSLVIDYDDQKRQQPQRMESDWHRERPSLHIDVITLADKSLVSAMMKSLNMMAEIRRLCVETRYALPMDFLIIPFIRKLADQLTMLEIDFAISLIGADAFPHLTRLRCGGFDPNPSAAFPKLAELIVVAPINDKELPNMRLPSLKKLLIIHSFSMGGEMVRNFILANAETLTVLQMSEISLLLDRAVVFPNLVKVGCRGPIVTSRCAFPALTHLTTGYVVPAEFLSRLPAGQMLSLDLSFHRERDDEVAAISKMKNLKNLTLSDDGTFSGIFDNMHHLEKVRLFAHDRNEQNDGMIAKLANQNPELSHVRFGKIGLTDAGLTSLAQLQHLTDVEIYFNKQVTTAGVLTLLRGSSRYVIRQLTVCGEGVDGDQMSREISQMCEERGTTCDKIDNHSFNYFLYVIHA